MYDDEFYLDLEDEGEQLPLVAETELEVLNLMETTITSLKDAIKYQEVQNIAAFLEKISALTSAMINLEDVSNSDDESILETIKEVNIQIKNLDSYQDIEDYAQDYDEINGFDLLGETEKENNLDNQMPDTDDDDFGF